MPKPRTRKTAKIVPIESSTVRNLQIAVIGENEIAQRAFELFCERGFQHGHDVEDWLRAERELRGSVITAVA
jgi:hypothetical protein